MMSAVGDILRALPKWLVIVAFFLFAMFMVISILFGRFMIAGYEFGFGSRSITNPPKTIRYTVVGNVKKEDGKQPFDITIYLNYPPYYPTGGGAIVGLQVLKRPDGTFPTLGFTHEGYAPEAVDLNNKAAVEEHDGELKIKETVVLKPIP